MDEARADGLTTKGARARLAANGELMNQFDVMVGTSVTRRVPYGTPDSIGVGNGNGVGAGNSGTSDLAGANCGAGTGVSRWARARRSCSIG